MGADFEINEYGEIIRERTNNRKFPKWLLFLIVVFLGIGLSIYVYENSYNTYNYNSSYAKTIAQNKLIIRDSLSISGNKIISIEYGSTVEILTDYYKNDVVDGVSGWWVYICYNGQYYGYVWDRNLRRL